MEREAKEKRDGGMRITVKSVTEYRCLGLPDNCSTASTPCSILRYQTTLWPPVSRILPDRFYWELKNGKLKRGKCWEEEAREEKEVFDKE